MPHVIVKMFAGRDDAEKQRLADEVTRAVISALGSSEKSVSVAIEDVAPDQWTEKVYTPDIEAKPSTIFKKPGYSPS